jgi:hypothetical protein
MFLLKFRSRGGLAFVKLETFEQVVVIKNASVSSRLRPDFDF